MSDLDDLLNDALNDFNSTLSPDEKNVVHTTNDDNNIKILKKKDNTNVENMVFGDTLKTTTATNPKNPQSDVDGGDDGFVEDFLNGLRSCIGKERDDELEQALNHVAETFKNTPNISSTSGLKNKNDTTVVDGIPIPKINLPDFGEFDFDLGDIQSLMQKMQSGELPNDEMLEKLMDMPFFSNMMGNCLGKDVLYGPMKDIKEKYYIWLAKNQSNLSQEDLSRYDQQLKIISDIVSCYEETTEDMDKITKLVAQIYDCGSLPPDLIQELSPEAELGPDGVSLFNLF